MIFKNDLAKFDLEKDMPYQVDIERLRKGKVGGFFWCVIDREYNVRDTVELTRSFAIRSVYTPCPDSEEEGPDYVNATLSVRYDTCCMVARKAEFIGRDTMEQVDLSKVLIDKYSDVRDF